MGFPKGVQEARSRSGIEDTVRRFGAEADHGDSAILVFLTHGCVDGVYGTDGKVFQLNQVFVLLSPENSPQLALKPKLIFVESCRGSNRDAGYSVVEDPGEDQVLERSGVCSAGEKKPKAIPMNPDFLISYSTSPGHVAFAHPRFGAYHVQLLCRTIAERAHQDDLETVMVAVRKGISQMEFRGEKGLLKQMPESWEAEGLIQIEPEYAMNDFQMTAHSDSVINSTEPLFLEEPATSDEHPSTDEQEEKLMNELYGQLVFMREEKKREAEKKSSEQTEKKRPAQKVQRAKVKKVPAKKSTAKATASKVKSGSNLDEYELEALKKVGIKIRETAKDQVLKDQDAVEGQKKVKKSLPDDVPKMIEYQFKSEDLIRGKGRWMGEKMKNAYDNRTVSQCLIITIPDRCHKDEIDADISNLAQLFQELNFSLKESRKTVQEFGKDPRHGNEEGIVAADNKSFDPMRAVHLLTPHAAPLLAGKPKILFYENCRGSQFFYLKILPDIPYHFYQL
ncbi:hypothetical protein L5515_012776 [Caenorhabditis briggsae]|uniref:Peptidase C14A caspase catalytic domain-containing protein n=1 Tax=Caenorhabditis briggsae TaxID=6238 RepID=A0AAE9EXZ7_CAEBR|nr:hypothetical protein L5515_012776 [Caenorhabditis briggsae]